MDRAALPPSHPLSACKVGDSVVAVWAGNRKRLPGRIAAVRLASAVQSGGDGGVADSYEIDWEDGCVFAQR